MTEPPKSSVEMTDFLGLYSDVDQRNLPPGAAEEQVNGTCLVQGEMLVRQGYRQVRFENG